MMTVQSDNNCWQNLFAIPPVSTGFPYCVRQTPSLPAPVSRFRHSKLSNGGVLQGALAVAYVIEGLLFAFHLRGDQLDVEIHTLLVITIFLTAIVIFAEIQHKSNVLLASLRPILVIMQGVWFVQAAFILFRGTSVYNSQGY